MKAGIQRLTAFFISILCIPAVHAADPTDLQKHLQDRFLNKIFMIRNFYGGSHLVFDSRGNLLEGNRNVGYEGCWSAAQIEIHKLELNKDRLTLRGPRVFGIYDTKTKEISQLGREHQDVQIELRLEPAQLTEDSITDILARIFLTREDDLGGLIPDIWTASVTDLGATGQDHSAVFSVGKSVTGPKPLHTPDPEYSDEARKAKYQGDINLWCVIGPNGKVIQIKLRQCLGHGLDEQAVRALSQWTFQPATKDGQPVAVQLNVSMTFHLY